MVTRSLIIISVTGWRSGWRFGGFISGNQPKNDLAHILQVARLQESLGFEAEALRFVLIIFDNHSLLLILFSLGLYLVLGNLDILRFTSPIFIPHSLNSEIRSLEFMDGIIGERTQDGHHLLEHLDRNDVLHSRKVHKEL